MHDVADGGDIESTSRDIGSEKDGVVRRLEAIERLETGTLLHAGMELDDIETEKNEERVETTNTIDGREEDDSSAGVAEEEVVEVDVLRVCSG